MADNYITDKSNDRKYFGMYPLIVKFKCRDPYDFILWNTVREIAGEAGECYINTEDLAALSLMSVGKVSDCRRYLLECGLLQGAQIRRDENGQAVWHLTIPDLWSENVQMMTQLTWKDKLQAFRNRPKKKPAFDLVTKKPASKPSPDEGSNSPDEAGDKKPSPHEGFSPDEGQKPSPHEGKLSPHETNKIPIIRSNNGKEENPKNILPSEGADAPPANGHLKNSSSIPGNGDTPVNLEGWLKLINQPPPGSNVNAQLRRMYQVLYPENELPHFGRFGKLAKQVGGPARLAQLIWEAAGKRPVGDVLSYIEVTEKARRRNGANQRNEPRGRPIIF